ncbi:hypothetical protein BDB00DRAFT_746955, partial [Zychaea mexicana]|uniref:uncharacterized protein n=1 Tax=Zychaea mexicana TaxID=64656 RepID=UPI0022FEF042
ERTRCTRWRLGWQPGGKPKSCSNCKHPHITKRHAIDCHNMHARLRVNRIQHSIPLSFILNQLP